MLKRGPQDQRERRHGALRAPTKADDLQALLVVVLERTGHLIEEIGEGVHAVETLR